MSDTKTTYIMPDGLDTNQLLPWMTMMGNGGMNGMWNNPFIYLVWMMFANRFFGNGYGENGLAGQPAQNIEVQAQLSAIREQLSTNQNTSLLMDAIKGNATALGQLASSLNCDFGVLKDCCCNIQQAIATVGGQVGFSAERVINAVERGDCDVIQALKDCCCETQKSIITQNYENRLAINDAAAGLKDSVNYVGLLVEKGFSNTNYETQAQTCAIQNTIRDAGTANTNAIIAKLDAMQNQSLLDKIDSLREKNSEQAVVINNAQLSAAFSQMLNSYTAPIASAVNTLQTELASVKCRLPETVTLPYSCATAIPTTAIYGNGWGFGNWGFNGWNSCGCNNSLWG